VAAHEGLRIVLSHQSRLPKELLQTGLRPILMNLADPKRLSVPNLEGLARLLELLTNYFKVEIGHKLIDHFRILADLNTLRDAAYSPLEDNEEILKLVRLVNIFHLLPCPGAGIFLEDLVNLVVTTESHLHAASPTPLTEPLARFLDRYPTEAVAFFSQHLNEPRHVRTFRNVLVSKLAPAVHARLLEQTNNFIIPSLRNDSGPLIMSGLLLCLDLVELDPKWIVLQEGVIDALLEIWRKEFFGPVASNYEPMGVHTQEASVLLSLLLKYLEQNPRFDILFDVVAVYAARIGLDLTALTRFFHKTVAMNNSTTFKRELLLNFLAWFDSPEPSWVHKTHVLRVVINPMLLISYSHKDRPKGDNVVDAGVMSQIQAKIFRPMVTLAKDVFPGSDDGLKIELMHTSSILLQHCSELMQDTRKEVVKFAWVYITSEDAIVKQTAYVLLARFFDVFEAPAKLIIRVWTALLRPVSHTEGRNLIRQAIDILAPALPRRFAPEPGPSPWAKLTRKILVEEGHGLSQVVLVYQVIMRHADLFFPYRELFASHMVHSLTKLGLPPSASPETRAMTLDILDLILTWERKRTKESESLMDLDSPQATNDPHAGDAAQQWSMPLALRESCVSYLVRFVVTSPPDTGPKSIFVSRALNILRDLLTIPGWGEVAIKLGFFHRALIQVSVTGILLRWCLKMNVSFLDRCERAKFSTCCEFCPLTFNCHL
jgi:transformation/transcription domain-associated protein